MATDLTLHQRRRNPTPDELRGIPWLALLRPDERERAVASLLVGDAQAGDYVCRLGKPVTYWFGVVEGLLKMSADNAQGTTMTFTGVPPGGWFGEGTALKRETYRYNIQALRKSVVAGLPIDSFHWLLDHSIGFNRFVMNQLNERLGQFISAREIDRMNSPDLRVARNLAALFNPVLYPGVGKVLRITQQEMAYLVGLSRQRVNEALRTLEAQGMIQVEYGGLRVLDIDALRCSVFTENRQLLDAAACSGPQRRSLQVKKHS
ncbi:MAG: Crp/Fnr family transcriptional regulator [Pseudomonadota bacterium]|nr:Crp/Fnr family transcriptional regulator [Pseudomonadota bacterium]